MSTPIINGNCHAIGELYAGMTKESIRADIDCMFFKTQKERKKAYDKQIKLFDYANRLIKGEADNVISQNEVEAYNKKEQTKKILKTVGLSVLGIGAAIGAYLICKNFKGLKHISAPKINEGTCLKRDIRTLAEHENVSEQMFEPVFKEEQTFYKYVDSTPLEDISPLLDYETRKSGFATIPTYGCAYLKGSQKIPFGTTGVRDCAVAFLYNTDRKTHALYHAMSTDKNLHAKNIMKIMPEGFDKIIIATGSNADTAITATDLFNSAKSINPKALVEFKHSTIHLPQPKAGISADSIVGVEYISYDGNAYAYPLRQGIKTALNIPKHNYCPLRSGSNRFEFIGEYPGGFLC